MDYLLFLTGLFLLAAGLGCLLLFREHRQFWRCQFPGWPLFALALIVLGLKVWYGIVVFALGMNASAIPANAWLETLLATALLAFCLSPVNPNPRPASLLKWAALAALAAFTYSTAAAYPNSVACVATLLALSFGGAWQFARIHNFHFGANKSTHPLVIAPLLTVITALCLLPDAAGVCYDVHGQGQLAARRAFLTALAAGTVCSLAFCWLLWSTIYRVNRRQLMSDLMPSRRLGTGVILTTAIFTAASGAWFTHWLGNQARQQQTAPLLSTLQLAANNLDVNAITAIQGQPEEIHSPGYTALRTKLVQVRETLPGLHFTYLLGLRNQRLVFLVDAEDPASLTTFSPPGQPVEDYPQKWQPELAGAATFNGPDRDQWGVWFAACVPVRDAGRNVVALLGVDYPAAKWLQPLVARRLAAMVVTLSVALLLMALLGFQIIAQETELNLIRSRAEADRLALVAKRTDNAVVITDTAGRIEWVNEGFTKISGYNRDEALGKVPGSFLQHPEDNPTERSHIRACLQTGVGFETEIINHSKNGHSYIVHIECQPLVDNQGTLTGFMAIERDVTQARRSSSLLEAVTASSTTLLANRLKPGVWQEILAALGTAANADRCYIFQIHPHPVLGTPAMSQAAEWSSSAATPQIQNPELQNFSFHKNGYGRWLTELQAGRVISGSLHDFPDVEQSMLIAQEIRSLVVVPIFTGEQLTGFMGFDACHEDRIWETWEISILRSAAANIGLRQVVQNEADALALAHDEARHAALAADAANRAKSTFLATMSHEIRTPLNAVIGMASLLETTALDAQQQEIAGIILNSSNFLLDLLTDILDYSRIESGQFNLESAPFTLADLCREACDVVRPDTLAKQLEMSCQLAPQLPGQVLGDRTRIRQILVNLLGNAVKFTAAGFVKLTVTGQQSADGAWQLTFEVKDSGIGIAADAIDRLFNPFVQADSSTTRRFGGSGLGLAISKRLAMLMGGDISVLSTPAQGSIFRFTLTLGSAPEAATAPSPPPSDELESAHLTHLQVLVAEDNPNNQKVIRHLFQRLGITMDLVANGQQAVDAAAAKPYDIIILDIQMPVIDGLEASRKIRESAPAKRPFIIALTANAFQEDRDASHAAGMDEHLSKPITLTRLRAMLIHVTKNLHDQPAPSIGQHSAASTSAATTTEPTLVDTEQLNTFIDIGAAGYYDILGDLLRDIPVHLDNIRTFITAGDIPALKRRIHSLRGILACFGCIALTARLTRLDAQVPIPPALASPLHTELQYLWIKSLAAIKEWEQSVPSFTGRKGDFQS